MSKLFELRPLQQKALDMLRSSYASGKRRVVIQAPCGFGKTIVAAHILHGSLEKRKRTAFVVPMLSLIDQSFKRFAANGIHMGDMGVVQGNHPWRRPAAPIQICSVQTLASRGVLENIDLVVVDECHLQFDALRRWMEKDSCRWAGLSATPWARGMGHHWDDLVIPATTGELVEAGWLSKFRVFAAKHPDVSGVKIVAGEYHEGQLSAAMSDRTIVADVVENWIEHGEGRQTLCFAVDRAHAGLLHDQFASVGVASGYIDGTMDADERKPILEAYERGDIKVICSVGTMTTGVDVPCQCIIMARPTKSEILFVQMIGRGLRCEPGKSDCVIFDHTENHYGRSDSFGMVTDVHHARLRTDKIDAAERKAKEAEQKGPAPRECSQCHCLIPAAVRACPSCGFIPVRVSDVTTQEGELHEVGVALPPAKPKEKVKPETSAERLGKQGKQAIYSQLLGMQGGRSEGWVAHKYKSIFGVWPRGLVKSKATPTPELQIYMHHLNIAFAKSRKPEAQEMGDVEAYREAQRIASLDQMGLADAA